MLLLPQRGCSFYHPIGRDTPFFVVVRALLNLTDIVEITEKTLEFYNMDENGKMVKDIFPIDGDLYPFFDQLNEMLQRNNFLEKLEK